MNERWSLENLYTSEKSESFKKDFIDLDDLIKKLNQWSLENLKLYNDIEEKLLFYCESIEEILKYAKLKYYLNLRLAFNSNDTVALKFINKYENIVTMNASHETLFREFLKNGDNIISIIESNKEIKEYEFFIKKEIDKSKYLLSEKEEVLLKKMKVTGSSNFEKLRDNIISSMKINVTLNEENKILNFSQVRNLAYDSKKEIRKAGYEAELEAFQKIEIPIAACLNGIKAEVITECDLRGYNSVLERTLLDNTMDKEILNALISAIEESLPQLRKFLIHKSKKLGYENGLPFFEIHAPIGKTDYHFTYEEAITNIISNFENFSTELSSLAKHAFENGWVDGTPIDYKSDGAFCENIPSIKESRILSNFTGSYNDLSTLAHELGHAFHNFCMHDEKIINQNPPMPIAETASIFCEKIIEDNFIKNLNDEEKLTQLDNSLTDATEVLVDIISRFYFEDSFINEHKNGDLSVQEINDLMEKAQRKAFGDALDNNYLHKYMWIAKPHYYFSEENYYNFPYSYGYLFSQGIYELYIDSQDKSDFIKRYKNLLKISGKNTLESLAQSMNIDIRDKNFWLKSINSVVRNIEKYLSF